ncbi:MAG TPA: hypothetical protein VEC35_08055 [Noviherbaspirillum sp.]|nr:hypothetical protein [Noviherbaspirillum sp.]
MTVDEQITEQKAAAIRAATNAGDLPAALAIVDNQPAELVQKWMLKAGFSTTGLHNKRAFWLHVQAELARGASAKSDGFGLRCSFPALL